LSEPLTELTAAGSAPDFHRIPYYGILYFYISNTIFSGGKENYFIFTTQKITIIIFERGVLSVSMRNPIVLFSLLLLVITVGSCKKSCYQCNQYCSYCELKSDSSIVVKTCTKDFADHGRIDSIENATPNTYICNTLNNSTEVCDGPNAVSQAITYYEEEDYFCSPE
jgi:hypothetical protein